jgi:hypothetical protein
MDSPAIHQNTQGPALRVAWLFLISSLDTCRDAARRARRQALPNCVSTRAATPATPNEVGQAWRRLQGSEPTTLRPDPFTRLGARVSAAVIAFDDHPNAKRFTDRTETVTVDSVFAWLNRSGPGAPVQAMR